MLRSKVWQSVLVMFGAACICSVVFAGCNSGDTDGGEDTTLGTQFVGDGGSGAKLTIEAPATIAVGATVGFFVEALDPRGAPLAFLRVFCETEKGIAILEPSAGGVAFEHTGLDGRMSGKLGGLLPGSYIIECRAPEGYNLVARLSLKITGDVPLGFEGFPGAAGGNLGGGFIVDLGQDDLEDSDVLSVAFFDAGAGEGGSLVIDTDQLVCDEGDPADDSDDELEPFSYTLYQVSIRNDSAESVFVETVKFTIADPAGSSTSTQSVTLEIGAGCVGNLVGNFITFSGSSQVYAGSAFAVTAGTFDVLMELTGTTQNGDDFSVSDTVSVTIGSVDNCEVTGAAPDSGTVCGG